MKLNPEETEELRKSLKEDYDFESDKVDLAVQMFEIATESLVELRNSGNPPNAHPEATVQDCKDAAVVVAAIVRKVEFYGPSGKKESKEEQHATPAMGFVW